MLQLGNVCIEQTAALAPMASVADFAYRSVCKQYGASYLVSEMVSAKGLCYNIHNAKQLLTITPLERPMAIQLFGCEVEFMKKAVELVLPYTPDVIDINMGCPVPKVVKGGSGSALMKKPELAEKIVSNMAIAAGNIPVTVKMRIGWDSSCINAIDFARRMEQSGAAAITIHGRTRQQMYSGKANWECIGKIKQAVSIPVIASGDVVDAKTAKALYNATGADLIMVGRASMGRPWIFSQIRDYLQTGTYLPEPPLPERMRVMLEHIQRICKSDGEKIGMKKARAQAMHYLYGVKNAAHWREQCSKLTTFSDAVALAKAVSQK